MDVNFYSIATNGSGADSPKITDWITAIAAISQTVAVFVAAYFAKKGLDSWRREAIGKRQFELAEKALSLSHFIISRLEDARNPMIWAGEGSTRQKPTSGESEELSFKRDNYYAILERMEKNGARKAIEELNLLRSSFVAIYGPFVDSIFQKYIRAVNRITACVSSMIENASYMISDEDIRRSLAGVERELRFLEDDPKGPTEVTKLLKSGALELEELCRPIINRYLVADGSNELNKVDQSVQN